MGRESPPAEGTRTWWDGHSVIGTRTLTTDETRDLQRLARTTYVRGCVGCMACPFAFFVGLALLVNMPGFEDDNPGVLLAILAFVVGIALPVLHFATLWERGRRLRQDARAPEVEICEVADAPVASTGDQSAGQPAQGPHWCEVLRRSGALWSVDGARRVAWPGAYRAKTAARADPDAYVVWSPATGAEGAAGLDVSHRTMTAAEADEIRRHRHRSVLGAVLPALLLNLWAASGIILALLLGEHPTLKDITGNPSDLCVPFVALLWDVVLVRRCLDACRHAADLRAGRILLVRTPARRSLFEVTGAPGSSSSESASSTAEYLPVSRELWSVNGLPAPWRTAKPD